MYVILLFVLACLLGWVLWRRLCRTHMAYPLRLIVIILFVALVFVLLFWISVYVALFLSRN